MANITVNKLKNSDVIDLINNIRLCDKIECEIVGNKDIESILKSLPYCCEAYSAKIDGNLICIFGVNNIKDENILCWMICTTYFDNNKYFFSKQFVRKSKLWRDYFLKKYWKMGNYVHAKNEKAIKFLKFLGAYFYDTEYDINGEKFYQFIFGV